MFRLKKQLLRSLEDSPKSFWELVNSCDASLKEILKALEELSAEGSVEYKNGKFNLLKSSGLRKKIKVTCDSCKSGIKISDVFQETLDEFNSITADRPLPIAEYDQGLMNPESLARKAMFMYERGDLEGESILVLGDDDLFSLYAALTGLPEKVVVVELDDRIVRFIERISAEMKLNIDVVQKDLSKPFNAEDLFSAFVTEPPESLQGLKMFTRAGLQALKLRGAGYVGLTTLESSLSKWLAFEEWLLSQNAVITDILRDFSLYPEKINKWEHFYEKYPLMKEAPFELTLPEVDWYASCLIRVEKVERREYKEEDLYMDDETIATPVTG